MDPQLENQEWQDFHTRFNLAISDALAPRVEPRYVVRVERRVYVEHTLPADDELRWADVAILRSDSEPAGASAWGAEFASATAIAPVECELPMSEERHETFLVIRERESMEVVTVLETLSPANKRLGTSGRQQYLSKRESVLESRSHLIELDLLRGGARLPVVGRLPPGDFYAIVSRSGRRPKAEVYAWTLRHPLPGISVPLKQGDADVTLDLQAVFTTVYDRARYRLSLNYHRPLDPPLTEVQSAWARQLVEAAARPEV
jgi:hypothetical protein